MVIADHQNYAGYQTRTTREIPLVLLEPVAVVPVDGIAADDTAVDDDASDDVSGAVGALPA